MQILQDLGARHFYLVGQMCSKGEGSRGKKCIGRSASEARIAAEGKEMHRGKNGREGRVQHRKEVPREKCHEAIVQRREEVHAEERVPREEVQQKEGVQQREEV